MVQCTRKVSRKIAQLVSLGSQTIWERSSYLLLGAATQRKRDPAESRHANQSCQRSRAAYFVKSLRQENTFKARRSELQLAGCLVQGTAKEDCQGNAARRSSLVRADWSQAQIEAWVAKIVEKVRPVEDHYWAKLATDASEKTWREWQQCSESTAY